MSWTIGGSGMSPYPKWFASTESFAQKAFCVKVRFRAPQKSVSVDSYASCEIQIANGCLSSWSFLHVVPTKLLAGQQKLHFKNLVSSEGKKKKKTNERALMGVDYALILVEVSFLIHGLIDWVIFYKASYQFEQKKYCWLEGFACMFRNLQIANQR